MPVFHGRVVERQGRRRKVGMPQCDEAGGFPVPPPRAPAPQDDGDVQVTRETTPRFQSTHPSPMPMEADGSGLGSGGSVEDDEIAKMKAANARRVAAMKPEDVERELAEVREMLGDDALETLRNRAAPTTDAELDEAVTERSKLEWTDEKTRGLETAAAIACSPETSTPSARRFAISTLSRAENVDENDVSLVAQGLTAGLLEVDSVVTEADLNEAAEKDKYALENLRDAVVGLTSLFTNHKVTDAVRTFDLVAFLVGSRARRLDALQSRILKLARTMCSQGITAARALVPAVDRLDDQLDLVLAIVQTAQPEDPVESVSRFFDPTERLTSQKLATLATLARASRNPTLAAHIYDTKQPTEVPVLIDLGLALTLAKDHRRQKKQIAGVLASAAVEGTLGPDAAAAIEIYASLRRQDTTEVPGARALVDVAENQLTEIWHNDVATAVCRYRWLVDKAPPSQRLLAAVHRAAARAVCGRFDTSKVEEPPPPLDLLEAVAASDEGRILFAFALMPEANPGITERALTYAADRYISAPRVAALKGRNLFPVPPCWVLAGLTDKSVDAKLALQALLNDDDPYLAAIPAGAKLAHLAKYALRVDGDADAVKILRTLSDVSVPAMVAALRQTQDVQDLLAKKKKRRQPKKKNDDDDLVTELAEAVADRAVSVGPDTVAAVVAGVFLQRSFPPATRAIVWRRLGRVGLARIVELPDDLTPFYVDHPQDAYALIDVVATALANDGDDDSSMRRLGLQHLAYFAFLHPGHSTDFHVQVRLTFLKKHARNPDRLLADFHAALNHLISDGSRLEPPPPMAL